MLRGLHIFWGVPQQNRQALEEFLCSHAELDVCLEALQNWETLDCR